MATKRKNRVIKTSDKNPSKLMGSLPIREIAKNLQKSSSGIDDCDCEDGKTSMFNSDDVPPVNVGQLIDAVIDIKTYGYTAAQKQDFFDCFLRCMVKKNPAIERCARQCVRQCRRGPTPLCTACILACGALSWYAIIKCAWDCS